MVPIGTVSLTCGLGRSPSPCWACGRTEADPGFLPVLWIATADAPARSPDGGLWLAVEVGPEEDSRFVANALDLEGVRSQEPVTVGATEIYELSQPAL